MADQHTLALPPPPAYVDVASFLIDVGYLQACQITEMMESFQARKVKTGRIYVDCYQKCKCIVAAECRAGWNIENSSEVLTDQLTEVRYDCITCGKHVKTYILRARRGGDGRTGEIMKLAEWPPYVPRIPPRVFDLIRGHQADYRSALLAESIGLGVAAHSYYRRAVEGQRDKLLHAMRSAAVKLGDVESKAHLDKCIAEKSFTNSLRKIKIPEAIMVEGQNPLVLLHQATSNVLHDSTTDEEALAICRSIRTVLAAMAEKIEKSLEDHREIKAAVVHLQNFRQKDQSQPS
jgi:hypothetical protein